MAKIPQETGRGFNIAETTAVMLSNVTTETTLFSQTIPAGKMGAVKRQKFKAFCTLTTPLLSLPSLTIKIRFGSSIMTVTSGLGLGASLTSEPFMITGEIINKSVNSQVVWARIEQGAATIPLLLGISSSFKGAKWTEDTTTDKTFSITGQFSLLSATTSLSVEHCDIELS